MPPLTKDISRPWKEGRDIPLPAQAGVVIRQGAAVEIDAAGRVARATKAANKTYPGVAMAPCDNTGGAAGAKSALVRRAGLFLFETTGTAVPGKTAYLADDNTVTDVAAGASRIGRIEFAAEGGVYVSIG